MRSHISWFHQNRFGNVVIDGNACFADGKQEGDFWCRCPTSEQLKTCTDEESHSHKATLQFCVGNNIDDSAVQAIGKAAQSIGTLRAKTVFDIRGHGIADTSDLLGIVFCLIVFVNPIGRLFPALTGMEISLESVRFWEYGA